MMLVPIRTAQYRLGTTEKGSLTEIDITEASAANLTPNTILVAHAKILEMQESVTVLNL